jgi:hypothetical protein
MSGPPQVLVLACGALARELGDITRLNNLDNVTVECLPGILHNRPERIPDAVRQRLEQARNNYDRILVGYADCGTGGRLAEVCREAGVEMLEGAHCYQFFTGQKAFDALHGDDPTAFYLTDYLTRHFNRLVLDGLGITEHPELLEQYFGNYTKVVYLAQSNDPELLAKARAAAAQLQLAFVHQFTGFGELTPAVVRVATGQEQPA